MTPTVSAVQSWRRYTILGVLAFIAGVAVWATMAWTDVVGYDVPKGQTAPPSESVECGHLFGNGPLVVVPLVDGSRRTDAIAALRRVGLGSVVYGPDGNNRIVVSTRPQAGTRLLRGSQIGLSTDTHVAPASGYKLSHKPCSGRASRRVLVFSDGLVGLVALVLLLTRFPVHELPEASNIST